MLDPGRTIVAIASAVGQGARGIVRVSGPEAVEAVRSLIDLPTPDDANRFALVLATKAAGRIEVLLRLSAITSGPVPAALWIWPGSRSYTGQPVVEVHVWGNPLLLQCVQEDLLAGGVHAAEPGEFTLRAFLAGKLDLIQAEAVLGVIDSTGQAELLAALGQLAGGLSDQLSAERTGLLDLLADLEAGLDFIEEDIEFISRTDFIGRVALARLSVTNWLEQAGDRDVSTEYPRVVLAGLPNAGKSTLLNALVGDARAIVSPIAGTTRDYLEATISRDGLTITLVDTPGWEADALGIMQHAQGLKDQQIEACDLVVWCEATDADESMLALNELAREAASKQARKLLTISTKADMAAEADPTNDSLGVVVSAIDGTGLDQFWGELGRQLSASAGSRQWLGTTVSRCRDSLTRCLHALERLETLATTTAGDELLAVDLRDALDALGEVTGAVYTDDLLDRVFSKFCIGK